MPGVFSENFNFLSPDEFGYEYELGNQKVMINVGSVGQPRDGDPRSCYVVIDDNVVRFRRVEYPLEETISKIYEVPRARQLPWRPVARRPVGEVLSRAFAYPATEGSRDVARGAPSIQHPKSRCLSREKCSLRKVAIASIAQSGKMDGFAGRVPYQR